MRITIKQLQEWEACYSLAELKTVFKGRPYLTPLQILNLKRVLIIDKFWVISRPGALTVKQTTKCVNKISKFIDTQSNITKYFVRGAIMRIERHEQLKDPISIATNFNAILIIASGELTRRRILSLCRKALESH